MKTKFERLIKKYKQLPKEEWRNEEWDRLYKKYDKNKGEKKNGE